MKIEINVLPDKQKEKIREEKKIGFALKNGFCFYCSPFTCQFRPLSHADSSSTLSIRRRKPSSEASLSRSPGKENQAGKSFSGYKQPSDECFQNKFEIFQIGRGSWCEFQSSARRGSAWASFPLTVAAQNFRFFQRQETIFLNFQDKLKNGWFSIFRWIFPTWWPPTISISIWRSPFPKIIWSQITNLCRKK